jgi:hypothetical protein
LNAKQQSALALARRGLRIFPLVPNGKVPAIENWQEEATLDRAQIKRWFSDDIAVLPNIGVSTAGFVVVDMDLKHQGPQNFMGLVGEREMLDEETPKSFMVKTQSGGGHIYLKRPDDVRVRNSVGKLAPGVDIKTDGGYVAGPGSEIDGRRYEVVIDRPIADAPAWLLREAGRARPKDAAAGERLVEETPAAVAEATAWINRQRAEDDPDAGNNRLFYNAAKLFDFGLEQETVEELVLDWNARLDDPMAEDIVEKTVASAMVNRQKPIGVDSPDYVGGFEVIEGVEDNVEAAPPSVQREAREAAAEGPASAFEPQWLDDLDVAAIPPRAWVIEGLAVRTKVGVLVGPGGVGKSTWANQCAVALATGRNNICGFKVPARERVWIWDQEDDAEEIDRRLAAVFAKFEVAKDDLYHDGKLMLARNSGVEAPLVIARPQDGNVVVNHKRMDAVITTIKREGVALWIVDPLVELHRLQEVDNGQMAVVWAELRRVAVQANCAVLVLAHPRKLDKADSEGHLGNLDTLRGASSQGGVIRKADTLFRAPAKDDKRWKWPPGSKREDFVRMDDAKNNLGGPRAAPRWFRHVGVKIANGEVVGVLEPTNLESTGFELVESRLTALTRVLRELVERGTWHKWEAMAAAMTPPELKLFEDEHNRTRDIYAAMGKSDRFPVDGGNIERRMLSKRAGYDYRFNPHDPQTTAEDNENAEE